MENLLSYHILVGCLEKSFFFNFSKFPSQIKKFPADLKNVIGFALALRKSVQTNILFRWY